MRRETIVNNSISNSFNKEGFENRLNDLDLEQKLIGLVSSVVSAEESGVFSEKFDAATNLAAIVQDDHSFDIVAEEEKIEDDFGSGIRRVPTSSFGKKP